MLLRICSIVLAYLIVGKCAGQPNRYAVESFGLKEGMLQTTISDAAFDDLNFMWVGYPNGIQKFTGNHFIDVPIQSGLPDDKWVRFFRLSTGDLLIAHTQGISRYTSNNNKFVHIFKNTQLDTHVPEFIGERHGVLWFYSKKLGINGLHIATNKTKDFIPFETILGRNIKDFNEINILTNLHQNGIILNLDNVFYLWNPERRKTIATVNIAFSFFGNRYTSYIRPDQKIQFYSKQNTAAYVLNFADSSYEKIQEAQFIEPLSIRAFHTQWQGYDLITFQNHVYYVNKKGQQNQVELLGMNDAPIIGEQGLQQILIDNYQNLYFRTTSDGFKKVSHSNTAISYYGTSQKKDNYVLCILPDKQANRILSGTRESGLIVYDTLKRVIAHIKKPPDKTSNYGVNAIIKDTNGDYLIYYIGESRVWRLHKNLKTLTATPHFSQQLPLPAIGYFHTILESTKPNKILTYSDRRLLQYSSILNKGSVQFFSTEMSELATLYKGQLVTQKGDELLFIDTATYLTKHKITLTGTGGVRSFAEKDDLLYIGTNKGVFVLKNAKQLVKHYSSTSGLPDECIYAMVFDSRQRLWCTTNKGVFCIKNDDSIFQLNVADGLQDNEFNTGAVATATDGELYFGGVNGISSFYPEAMLSQQEKMNLLVTDIRIGNQTAVFPIATWNVSELSLPHNKNILSFDFITIGQKNPSQYIHQYKMEGMDKEWTVNKDLQTVHYHLPPGKYTLNIFVSTAYTASPKAMKKIFIAIHPPFYQTWWFIILLSTVFLAALVTIINRMNKRKHRATLQALQTATRIQLERERISRDLHDNIGLHANIIIYNTELLETQRSSDEIMSSLRFASKDIITSLRETVWALKKEIYTADECLLRIRNYIHILKDYYPKTDVKVTGQAPPDKLLKHTDALNFVRIIQEGITNAIKHADATHITVHAHDTNSESWKITIEDNGKGFDPYTETTGNGLENMRCRAKESNFDFVIHSKTAHTVITIIIH